MRILKKLRGLEKLPKKLLGIKKVREDFAFEFSGYGRREKSYKIQQKPFILSRQTWTIFNLPFYSKTEFIEHFDGGGGELS